jgi:type IV secretion system protein VirB5
VKYRQYIFINNLGGIKLSKELIQPAASFKPTELPVDPYHRAKQEWDERIGSARVQAKNWRICALGSLVLCFILTIGLIYQSSKSTVTPYVVQVTKDGVVQAIGPAQNMNYVPQEKEIKYFLSQLVQNTRTLPLDPVVAKRNWLSSYEYLRPSAALKMNQYMEEDKLSERLGTETTQIEVNVVVPLSKESYQIRWKETVYDSDGNLKESYNMTGLFTIEFYPPKSEKELLVNPIGLYIKDFSWSREL